MTSSPLRLHIAGIIRPADDLHLVTFDDDGRSVHQIEGWKGLSAEWRPSGRIFDDWIVVAAVDIEHARRRALLVRAHIGREPFPLTFRELAACALLADSSDGRCE